MARPTLTTAGAILGALAVGLGAFGAHALEGKIAASGLEPMEQLRLLDTWEVGIRYQMYHALALLFCASLANSTQNLRLAPVASCFFVGTLIFSGSLYAYVLTGIKILGAIVPIGGIALIAGWLLLAWECRK
jgi:uncharacterized membrane protein YgdD (TMEM256/DUF423 family)